MNDTENNKKENTQKIVNMKENYNFNLINEVEIVDKIKFCPFFLSEFGLLLIILFIVSLFFLTPQYFSAKLFHSKKSKLSFDPNYIPRILLHITDIHISRRKPLRTNDSISFIKEILEYKPDLILTTGIL